MKKLLSLAIAAAVLSLAACTQNSYKITGTATGAVDGDTVTLNTFDFETLATTVVKDGRFEFTGVQDTAVMRLVVWTSNTLPDTRIATHVALENANITVELDTAANTAAKVYGTPANEALTKLGEAELAINQRGDKVYKVLTDESATEEQHAEAQKQLEKLQDEFISLYKDFIKANISNVAGTTYLQQYASMLPDEEVTALLSQVPAELNNKQMKELREVYDVKAQTAVGKPLKDITATTPDDKQLAVSEVAANAKVLLIDFWASWCGPCRAEMPNVKAAYEKFHPQGFEIIGVSLDSDKGAWTKAIADLGMTWPQISDLKGWECEGAAAYGVRAIPATVLVKDGTIVARDLRGEELAKKVEELLK